MMEDVLYCKDLHDPIKGDSAKPSDMLDKDWEKLNRKLSGVLDNASTLVFFTMCLKK